MVKKTSGKNTDLKSRQPKRSREQLKCMYPEWFDYIGEFKISKLY